MAEEVSKIPCPTCGQAMNKRVIKLKISQVKALLKVAHWLKTHQQTSAKMTEIRHLFDNTQYATFNEWRRFEPTMVFGDSGTYHFDLQKIDDAIRGGKLCIAYTVDPLDDDKIERNVFGTLRDAKKIADFLDEQGKWIQGYLRMGA